MLTRLQNLILLLLLSFVAGSAAAALQDLVNGRMVGKPIQPMQLAYYKTTPASLDNKVVLIDFWAAWCVPCRYSLPMLNRLHADLEDKGLVILGVTRDPEKDIGEFVKKIPIDFAIASDVDGAFFKRLSLRAMPYAALADRSGNIVWQGDPGALTRERVEALLATPAPAPARAARAPR